MSIRKCPKCNSEIGNWDFCFFCGANLKEISNSDSQNPSTEKLLSEDMITVRKQDETINSPKKCPKCNSEIGEWDFCFHCGANLKEQNNTKTQDIESNETVEEIPFEEEEKNSQRLCPECGNLIGEWDFCFHCGANLKRQNESEALESVARSILSTESPQEKMLKPLDNQVAQMESKAETSNYPDSMNTAISNDFENDTPPDNIVVLTDEDGNEAKFEFLDLIAYRGKEYVVFLPNNETADEVVILEFEELSDGTENYSSVDDDFTLQVVYELFKQRAQDKFNFID